MLQCSGVLQSPQAGFPEVFSNQKLVHGRRSESELTADVDLFRNWESSIAPNPEYVVCCGLQSEAFVDMH